MVGRVARRCHAPQVHDATESRGGGRRGEHLRLPDLGLSEVSLVRGHAMNHVQGRCAALEGTHHRRLVGNVQAHPIALRPAPMGPAHVASGAPYMPAGIHERSIGVSSHEAAGAREQQGPSCG